MRKTGYGRAPGAAGELVQGQLTTGQDFLVSLPVALWSEVQITLDRSVSHLTINYPEKTKTCQAVRYLLESQGMPRIGGNIEIKSSILVGKGMASSTADITAACKAAGDVLGIEVTAETIAAVARQIEPTDGIMYPGLVSFDHVHGALIEYLGKIPPMDILVVDLGGMVDTLEFNQQAKDYTLEEMKLIQQSFDLLRVGIDRQDLEKIGQAGIISARVNQRLLFKPELESIINFAQEQGAVGICAAHSGTIVSLLFEPFSQTINNAWSAIENYLNGNGDLLITSTTSRGNHDVM